MATMARSSPNGSLAAKSAHFRKQAFDQRLGRQRSVGVERSAQPIKAKELAARILRIDHAIRIEKQSVAAGELHALLFEIDIWQDAENQSIRVQRRAFGAPASQ